MKYYYYTPNDNELHETEENWCPDGNGFMVIFKGDYKHYLKHKDQYSLVGQWFVQEGEIVYQDV